MKIALPPDFHPSATLRYLDRSPLERLHKVVDGQIYKLLPIPGAEPLLLRLTFLPEGSLQVDAVNRSPLRGEEQYIRQYLAQWWDLDRDLAPFYRLAERDALLRQTLHHRGLRLMGVPELFEALCWSVIGQQINLPFAYQLKGRLVETFGRVLPWQGTDYCLFPEPEALAASNVETLFALKITRRKCEYLLGLAETIAAGKLSKSMLLEAGSVEAAARILLAQRGIGPWSAHYVLMRCLRYTDAYPVGDAGLQNAVKRLAGMDRKPTEAELLTLARDWRGWEAYATFYLWSV